MAWEVLAPQPGARGGHHKQRATIAYRPRGDRWCLVVTISAALSMELGWTPKEFVAAQIDRGAGLLRLEKAAEGWRLSGAKGTAMTTANLAMPDRLGSDMRPAVEVKHSRDGAGLVLELPAWACGRAAAAPPQPAPATRPAVQTPAPAVPRPVAAAPARPTAPPPKPGPEQDKADAIKMLEAGMSARTVADDMGLALSVVSNWAAEVRARQRRAA